MSKTLVRHFGCAAALALAGVLAAPQTAYSNDPGGAPGRNLVTVTAPVASDSAFLVANLPERAWSAQASGPGGGSRHEGIGIGVKGGYLYSAFKEAEEDLKSNQGFIAGIFFGGNRPGSVGVMGEILYAKKGFEDFGVKTDLYYLEIPILLRVNIGSKSLSGVSVYAIGGPAFDINLRARQKNLDVKKNYESLDVGVIGGAGVEITRVFVEGRVNWGLRNVLKSTGGANTDLKSRSVALMLGIRFN